MIQGIFFFFFFFFAKLDSFLPKSFTVIWCLLYHVIHVCVYNNQVRDEGGRVILVLIGVLWVQFIVLN